MNVVQTWLGDISLMQQSVLLSAIRGPDGVAKYHRCKPLIRWFRRCILLSAFEKQVLSTPYQIGGGSFTGESFDDPDGICENYGGWEQTMGQAVNDFLMSRDELPFHYFTHMMHAFEILGYQHPRDRIRLFWLGVYERMARSMHLEPETAAEMKKRLGDDFTEWSKRADEAGSCSA